MQGEFVEDPYAVLGVSRSVTPDELKRAYRRLSMAWHPDRHATAADLQRREAERRFKLVNSAYVAIGELLRSGSGSEHGDLGQAAAVEQSDIRIDAIRAVVASAALRVVPNLPRHAFRRVIGVVEQVLIETLAVGDRAFAGGFETALRDAMYMVGADQTLRPEALSVLDAAADELQWRGKAADPKTWQTLLGPLERARRGDGPAPRRTRAPSAPEGLLRPEPPLALAQGALAILALLLLLPFVPAAGAIRVALVVADLAALGYVTFGVPRR